MKETGITKKYFHFKAIPIFAIGHRGLGRVHALLNVEEAFSDIREKLVVTLAQVALQNQKHVLAIYVRVCVSKHNNN